MSLTNNIILNNSMFKYKFLHIAVLLSAILIFANQTSPAFAKESNFIPKSSEIDIYDLGPEYATVSEEGGLYLYDKNYKLKPRFPRFFPGQTITSSPILANITGDYGKEILIITRDANNTYSLVAFNKNSDRVGSKILSNVEIYFDPVPIKTTNTYEDIAIANVNGGISIYRYANQTFSQITSINTNQPTGISTNYAGNSLLLNFPGNDGVDIYRYNSSNLTFDHHIDINFPIIYPIVENNKGILYGVNNDMQLFTFDPKTNEILQGFPLQFLSSPLGAPIIADFDNANQGDEMEITLSNGMQIILSLEGTVLYENINGKSFLEPSLETYDIHQNSLFSSIKNYAINIINTKNQQIASVFSRLKIILGTDQLIVDGEMADQSTDYWATWGALSLKEKYFDVNRQSQILHFIAAANSSSGIQQEGYAVFPGKTYELSFDVKIESGYLDPRLNIKSNPNYNKFADFEGNSNMIYPNNANNGWSHYSRFFTMPNDFAPATNKLRLALLATNSTGTAEIKIDNISIKEAVAPISNNLIVNGDMELDLPWMPWGILAVNEIIFDEDTGSNVSHISTLLGGGAGIQQIIDKTLTPGKSYEFSFDVKVGTGNIQPRITIMRNVNYNKHADFENIYKTFSANPDWAHYSRTFTVPDNFDPDTNAFRIILILNNSVRTNESWIDNISIVPKD